MARKAILTAAALACAFLAPSSWAADGPTSVAIFRGVAPTVRFDVSPPLRSLAPLQASPGASVYEIPERPTGLEGAFGPQDQDAAVQTQAGGVDMPTTIANFNGPPNVSSVSPPDPVGDVGPNHYVAMSNLSFQIFSKTGTSLSVPRSTTRCGRDSAARARTRTRATRSSCTTSSPTAGC